MLLFIIAAIYLGGFQCTGWAPRSLYVHQNPVPPLSREQIEKLKAEIQQYYRAPYLWGGDQVTGTDCSGFVSAVYFKALGVRTPRTAAELYDFCVPIQKSDLRFGDLVFFSSNLSQPTHVGLYVDRGYFLDASRSKGVALNRLNDSYYRKQYLGAGRVRVN